MENMKLNFIAFVAGCILSTISVSAQEKSLSQFYSNRMLFNPAMTGIANGTSMGINYRSQSNNIQMPMRILAVGAESKIKSLGFGVVLNSQSSGDGGFKTTNVLASFAYHLPIDQKNLVSFGLQGGVTSQAFDFSKLTFASQYSSAFGPIFPSGESFGNNRSSAIDVNTGIFYSNNGKGKIRPFGGVAFFHVNQPEQKMTAIASKIPTRVQIHGGSNFEVSDRVTLIPHFAYFSQARANLISGGINAKIDIDGKVDGIYFGGNYRNNDAMTFTVGTVYNHLALGFSYDAAVGNNKTASIGQSAIEFSVNYSFSKGAGSNFSFPVF
jgi:type IX secretion system PorP/SprF family membrane protein